VIWFDGLPPKSYCKPPRSQGTRSRHCWTTPTLRTSVRSVFAGRRRSADLLAPPGLGRYDWRGARRCRNRRTRNRGTGYSFRLTEVCRRPMVWAMPRFARVVVPGHPCCPITHRRGPEGMSAGSPMGWNADGCHVRVRRVPVGPAWAHSGAGSVTRYGASEGPRVLGLSVLLHRSRATVAITRRPAQSSRRLEPLCILCASQTRGVHERRECHSLRRCGTLGAR